MATLSLAFHPGQMVQTRSIFDACCEHLPFFTFVRSCIARHLQGDWGDCCPDDAALNDAALKGGGRLFSVYHIFLQVSYALRARFGLLLRVTDHTPQYYFPVSIDLTQPCQSWQGFFLNLFFTFYLSFMRHTYHLPGLTFDPGTIVFSPGITSALTASSLI
jgi:hypothetical protein